VFEWRRGKLLVRVRSMKWTLLFIGFANELQGAKVIVFKQCT
jgi:hypothetical protein